MLVASDVHLGRSAEQTAWPEAESAQTSMNVQTKLASIKPLSAHALKLVQTRRLATACATTTCVRKTSLPACQKQRSWASQASYIQHGGWAKLLTLEDRLCKGQASFLLISAS